MKIGILTFHSQLNYGGVLQCWALVQALKGMGHEVVVVDRWLTPDNIHLELEFSQLGIKGWFKFFLRCLTCCGDFSEWVRSKRTKRFVNNELSLTPYHFCEWKDAPEDLGVDCLVVGSDQVWHGGDWGDPRPYLLEGAPSVKAIAYAASFGMSQLPPDIDYAAGFRRFAAISCREAEGVRLVESKDHAASHVVDPTLLLAQEVWKRWCDCPKVPRRLVCYFMSQNVGEAIKILEPWARENKCSVEILCDSPLKALPRSARACFLRMKDTARFLMGNARVRVCGEYGPYDFVRAFARAEMCVTDSFHAVMFSSIYGCNVRFIKPQNLRRKTMFARIEEFAGHAVTGDMFVDDLKAAVDSFDRKECVSYRQSVIAAARDESIAWIEEALKAL